MTAKSPWKSTREKRRGEGRPKVAPELPDPLTLADVLTQASVKKIGAAGVPGEWRDARTRGLILRVRGPGQVTWSYRRTYAGRDYRLILGPVERWTVDEARGIVSEIEVRLEVDLRQRNALPWFGSGFEWSDFIAARVRRAEGLDDAPAPERERVAPGPRIPQMAWSDAVDQWADELARVYREATAYGYRMALNITEMKRFSSRSVAGITRVEAAEAIAEVHARGAERQANVCAVAFRSLFEFLGRDQMTRKTGVEAGRMAALKAPRDTLFEGDDDEGNSLLVPDGPMVGHLMRAFRDGSSALSERDRLAGQLLLYTVQRRRPIALARREDFESAGEHGGLWKLKPLHRKTASTKRRRGLAVGDHVICLPISAWAVVKRAIEIGGDSEWLFPAVRKRRAELEATSLHPSHLTHMFADVAGNPATPHDMRRAFATTYANEFDLEDHQVKAVLDHAEGVKSGDTTREHYRLTSGEHRKWPVMVGWVSWVDKWSETRD